MLRAVWVCREDGHRFVADWSGVLRARRNGARLGGQPSRAGALAQIEQPLSHMSYFLSEFADCLLRAKHYDEADRALREAEQVVAETDERSHASELLRLRGRLLALRGSISEVSSRQG